MAKSSLTVGTISYPQTMNLTNTGTSALTFTVTVNGDFAQTWSGTLADFEPYSSDSYLPKTVPVQDDS